MHQGPRHKGSPPTEPFDEILKKGQDALDSGDLALAEKYFGQATVAQPASPKAWYGKGRAFTLQEEWDKALRCYAIAVKFDASFFDAWLARAETYMKLEDSEKARADLEKAESLRPNDLKVKDLRTALP